MQCVKQLRNQLAARYFDRQVAEFQVRVAFLNGFTALGILVTEVTGKSVWGNETSGKRFVR